jgi:hypothetical protein
VFPYPNATVAEFGDVWGEKAMMTEIFARGRRESSLHTNNNYNCSFTCQELSACLKTCQ